jgi:NADH-quinone oxidoreductase subunit F
MIGTTYPHAPGFVAGDRPRIVTSRFEHADSYTLHRFLATDGYKGLQAALAKSSSTVTRASRARTRTAC